MDTININYLEDKFNELQTSSANGIINNIRKEGFSTFNKKGVPTSRNEEWKFTSVGNLFKKEYNNINDNLKVTAVDVDAFRLAGTGNATELIFVNGIFSKELSTIHFAKEECVIMPLEDAVNSEFKNLVNEHLNKSSLIVKDGIHALNTSFIDGGVFIYVNKNVVLEQPVFLYHICDARNTHTLSQPRSLIYIDKSAKLQLGETFATIGAMDSFTNEVMEIVVNTNAIVEYYKVQNDTANASQVNTTHIRQIGKSYTHAVTVSVSGGLIRNNTNIVMEAEGNEAHLYGLYLLNGNTHVDNHTMVDNTKPNCFSNELYKGVLDDNSSGVFSGKIFVRPDAQKTNAYQSNKNILLSDNATINTKPQLEIFADDVKCSHGCTVGQLDEEALFYLRSRGISKDNAQAMLLKAFAEDVVTQIKYEPLKNYVEKLITERLLID